MLNRWRMPLIFCLAALAVAAAGCSQSTTGHTPQAPVPTPDARQAMRRDMSGPSASAPAGSQTNARTPPSRGAAGN